MLSFVHIIHDMARKFGTLFIVIFFAVALLGLGAYLFLNGKETKDIMAEVRFGDTQVKAEIADDPEERERGLSGREPLKKSEGMLFLFEEPGLHAFWMKDMKFSIDILWLNEQKQVVHIAPNVSPDSYPQRFVSKAPALYVLEVPAGFAAAHGIQNGYYAELLTK